MQRYAACSDVSGRALVCLCVRVCYLVRPGLRVILVMQARLRLTDVCAELKSIFTCHGALEYEASVLAPKPAKPSKSTMSELRLLHAPAVTSSDGHDITHASAKFADVTSEELNRTLGLERSASDSVPPQTGRGASDDALVPLYARSLDMSGTVIQLPYDLCEVHARCVARHRIQQLKRCVRASVGVKTSVYVCVCVCCAPICVPLVLSGVPIYCVAP